jgi:stress response protein YsnF
MTYDNDTPMAGSARSVSAMFDTRGDAQNAVDRLLDVGITSGQIRMVEGATDAGMVGEERVKGFWESLGDMFLPDDDRYTYSEGLSRGGYLVTVTDLAPAHYDTVLDILDDEGTVNLDEREESWRSEGWGGYESSPYAAGGSVVGGIADQQSDRYADRTVDHDEDSIPVVEEQLAIGKRDTSHGRVRVRAYTVEEPVSKTVHLRDERVELERRPVDRAAGIGDAAFQDRTIEAEEHTEEAVVSKEARVVEEIGLRRVSDSREETVTDTVRHTEVEVDDDRTGITDDELNRTRR